jgi:transcriptional regulator of met regulon
MKITSVEDLQKLLSRLRMRRHVKALSHELLVEAVLHAQYSTDLRSYS